MGLKKFIFLILLASKAFSSDVPSDQPSVAQAIAQLPPEFKNNVVVIFKSESLQEGSCLNPRVLLFSNDGQTVLSFNGSPSQYGFESIEVQRFDPRTARFSYQEKQYSSDVQARVKYLRSQKAREEEILTLQNHSHGAGVNPSVCLACHGADPRPNWNAYLTWKNTMGDNDGVIFSEVLKYGRSPFNFGDQSGMDRNTQEANKCAAEFVYHYKNHPRYKYLNLDPLLQQNQSLNGRFTNLMFELNFQRINRMIEQGPRPSLIKMVLVSYIKGCHPEKLFGLPTNYQKLNAQELGDTFQQYIDGLNSVEGNGLARGLVPLMKHLEVDVLPWYTMFHFSDSAQFTTPDSGGDQLIKALRISYGDADCSYLNYNITKIW